MEKNWFGYMKPFLLKCVECGEIFKFNSKRLYDEEARILCPCCEKKKESLR